MIDSERINQVLMHLKLNASALAKSLQLGNKTRLYNIIKGHNGISADLAKIITEKYPEINYNWLLTGVGEMLNSSSGQPIEHQQTEPASGNLSDRELIESQQETIRRLSEAIRILSSKIKEP